MCGVFPVLQELEAPHHYYLHLADQAAEVQGSEVTCPKPHCSRTKPGCRTKSGCLHIYGSSSSRTHFYLQFLTDLTGTSFSCVIWEGGELPPHTYTPGGWGEKRERRWKNKSGIYFEKGGLVREVLSWPAERERLFGTSSACLTEGCLETSGRNRK